MLVIFLKILIYPLSILPLWLIRVKLYPFYIAIAYIVKYRQKVILKNLKIAYPNQSETFYKQTLKGFYKHFYLLICEGIKSFTISKKAIVKRFKIDEGIIKNHAKSGKSVVMVFGHYNNWEWPALAAPLQITPQLVAIYQPVKNKALNNWIKANRSRFGAILVSTKEVNEFYKNNKQIIANAFIADQSPPGTKTGVWVDFFGRKTLFLAGAAAKAKELNQAIIYVYTKRTKPGYYTMYTQELCSNPQNFTVEELTQEYAHRLEQQIKENPSEYLWSHNRWKHKFG